MTHGLQKKSLDFGCNLSDHEELHEELRLGCGYGYRCVGPSNTPDTVRFTGRLMVTVLWHEQPLWRCTLY